MVAKRDLTPRFFSELPKRTNLKVSGQYPQNRHASARSNFSTSRNKIANLPIAPHMVGNSTKTHGETVAQNVKLKQDKFYRAKTTESLIVIAVNVALSLAAIAAIAKLLPYQSSQKDRLDEINVELNSVEQRVNELRENLPQTFNSGKSQETLLRKHGLIKNNQMTIKLLDPTEIATPDSDGIMPTTSTAQKPSKAQ
ncbi:MAG: hypothetical protein AUK48_05425 [Oscillatoriales cyanobacterium CG2_30_44_21]|nr:MAG: hypothetical protein AUK48_05425 [Oscillatoriales cyanobacterium CG2_30_44_21]